MAGGSKVSGGTPGRRRIDFDSRESLDFSGVETLLLVSAGYGEDDEVIRRHGNAISAAEEQGVRQVVYTSLTESGDHLAFALAHRWTERRLQASATLQWTILRNGLYAELIASLAAPAAGVVTTPFGEGRLSPVARSDLARAAVTVLASPRDHAGQVYELSGVTAWTVGALAAGIGASYEPVSFGEQRLRLASAPLLPYQPPMLMSIYSAAAAGFLETRATDLGRLLPGPATDSLDLAIRTLSS